MSKPTLASVWRRLYSQVLDWLLGEELLDLVLGPEERERRLDEAVEQEGEVDEEHEPHDLEPLERLPAQAQGHDPDEEGAARVDGGARGGAHGAGDGEAKEVEPTGGPRQAGRPCALARIQH